MLESLLKEREVNIPSEAEFYKGTGCAKCMDSGLSGRIPIYEVMVVTPGMQKSIEAGLPHSKLREVAIGEGMVELAPAGVEQALAGRTTIEEVYFKLSS